MAKDDPSTNEHRGPARPTGARPQAAFVCAFPLPRAVPIPAGGSVVGREWLAAHGVVDTEVSSRQFRVDRRGGGLRVADAGSRNGTWINGARLGPSDLTPLDDGAVLRVGRTILVYREALLGGLEPSEPIGSLVGPFGLRAVARGVSDLGVGPGHNRSRGGDEETKCQPSGWHAMNVLIEGETGVGKELVARALAAAAGRAKPFAAVNVAALARGVFESQLFGHVAGAFSDARTAAHGIAVAHARGTLFLDEFGELDLDLQAKLLRLAENREVLPVGGARAVTVDILLLAATNRPLEAMVAAGTFRRDLFARLAMRRVTVPALRQRPEDLLSVATALAKRRGEELSAFDIEVEAMERLILDPWPNNVRGLDATLAAVRRTDPQPGLRRWAVDEVLGELSTLNPALTEEGLAQAVRAADGNVTAAAASLGVSRGRLLRFQKKRPRK